MKNSEKTRPTSKGNKEKQMNTNRPSPERKGKENGKSKKQDEGKKKSSDKENSTKTFNEDIPLKDPDSTSVEEHKNNDPTIPEKKKELYDGKHNQQTGQQKPPHQNESEQDEPEEEGDPNPEIFNPQAKKNEAFSGEKKNEQHTPETHSNKKGL